MLQSRKTYARNVLICIAVAANALSAGGVFIFPLIAPALADYLRFTQPQITTIALAGMVGQYPFAALVGKIRDAYGPRACSFIAGVLFSTGFGLFSRELSVAPENTIAPNEWAFRRLFLYFGMIGLGTVVSYFSTVFAATSTFPLYNGIASGTSMALFGSSPLLITMIATRYFSVGEAGIDVKRFLTFLAILTATTHIFGTFALRVPSDQPAVSQDEPIIIVTDADEENNSYTPRGISPSREQDEETTALLATNKPAPAAVQIFPVQEPRHESTLELLQDGYFWIFALIITVVVGSSEMIMANLASIFLSLPPGEHTSSSTIAAQIQLLAIANTTSRLLIGPLSDLLSPVAAYIRSHTSHHDSTINSQAENSAATPQYVYSFPRKQVVSRMAFQTVFIAILLLTFSFMEFFVRSRGSIWVMSVGVGLAYGGTFTILPGILVSVWGAPNLGRNFGIISYAPFVGTSIFSYLYAYVVQQQNSSPGEGRSSCKGAKCWQSTFAVCMGSLFVSLLGSLVLWRRWRARV